MPDAVCVLIASPLEPELVARIGGVDRRVSVLYAPDLMPEPRYPADHTGAARPLSPADVDRWSRLRAQSDISFDFGWQDPARIPRNCPRLASPVAGENELITDLFCDNLRRWLSGRPLRNVYDRAAGY